MFVRYLFAASLVSSLASLFFSTANAQSEIDFDHAEGGNVSRTAKVGDGEVIAVNILDTCPKLFNYGYVGYEGPKSSEARRTGGSANIEGETCTALEDAELKTYIEQNLESSGICVAERKTVRIPHEAKYGGYLVEITRIDPKQTVRRLLDKNKLTSEFVERAKSLTGPNAPPCASVKQQAWEKTLASSSAVKPLADSSILISVEHTGWTYGIAGAFTGSHVTNHEFAIVPNDSTPATDDTIVIRNKDGEDSVALGAAAMIHLYNPDLSGWISNWAISFGLGISEGNKVSYFLGPSYRFGKQAFMTIGVNIGSIDTLPAGQRVGVAPETENVLNNLGSKTEGGLFLSISYSFLNPGEGAFKGPFATKATGTEKSPAQSSN